jgi:TonB family protein
MGIVRTLMICAASLLVAQVCAAQQASANQAQKIAKADVGQSQAASGSGSAPVSTAIPSYPDTPKGLEDLMNEMLKLEKKHDAKSLAPYVESLELPNASAWFRATFGDEIGKQLGDSYDRTRMNLPLAFPDILEQLRSKHLEHARAVEFTDSCNADASEDEYNVLINRENEQPLYDIRFSSTSEAAALLYFAYVDGAFRYISNFRLNLPRGYHRVKTPSPMDPGPQVPGELTLGHITKQTVPIYPQEAKMQRISGKVFLHAIIGKNGEVCNLHLQEGNPLLAQAALAAVRQWRYSPYKINGKPVEVDTTITVIFNLH